MIQVMLGNLGVVTSEQMFSVWRYVVVGATVAAAVLTPSTDPFTQVGQPAWASPAGARGRGGGAGSRAPALPRSYGMHASMHVCDSLYPAAPLQRPRVFANKWGV